MQLTFGLKTTPMHVPYADIQRVWLEADEIPEIRDAWLWDHFHPLAGAKDGPVLEGWTLLTALAAQTTRLRSEEHTSELQSRRDLVCRLLLEKKKKKVNRIFPYKKQKKKNKITLKITRQ